MTTCKECKQIVSHGSHVTLCGVSYDTPKEIWIEFCPKHARMIETWPKMLDAIKKIYSGHNLTDEQLASVIAEAEGIEADMLAKGFKKEGASSESP